MEITVNLHNNQVKAFHTGGRQLAMVSTPWLGHEMNSAMEKRFATIPGDMAKRSDEEVKRWRFAWNFMRALSQLAYYAGKAILIQDVESTQMLRNRVLAPMRNAGPGEIERVLWKVARRSYLGNYSPERPYIRCPQLEREIPGPDASDPELEAISFLLVNEIIVNYCRHARPPSDGEDISVGEFSIAVDEVKKRDRGRNERPSSLST